MGTDIKKRISTARVVTRLSFLTISLLCGYTLLYGANNGGSYQGMSELFTICYFVLLLLVILDRCYPLEIFIYIPFFIFVGPCVFVAILFPAINL